MASKEEVSFDEIQSRFLSVYQNVPIQERGKTVVVIDDEPISWRIAYLEIKNETDLGKKIGEKLVMLDIV